MTKKDNGFLGATGKFPDGQLSPDDEGELTMGVAHDSKGNVILNFGKPCDWIAMPPEMAIQLATTILRHAGVSKIEITP